MCIGCKVEQFGQSCRPILKPLGTEKIVTENTGSRTKFFPSSILEPTVDKRTQTLFTEQRFTISIVFCLVNKVCRTKVLHMWYVGEQCFWYAIHAKDVGMLF